MRWELSSTNINPPAQNASVPWATRISPGKQAIMTTSSGMRNPWIVFANTSWRTRSDGMKMNISEAGEKKGDAPKGRLYKRRSMKFLQVTSTRVAMRTGASTLNFLLGDHLNSNAITTDSNGMIGSEIRYYPWGTTRYTCGTSPTTFQYTGQRVESSLGLLFYNARNSPERAPGTPRPVCQLVD